jgi:hypothetical protein
MQTGQYSLLRIKTNNIKMSFQSQCLQKAGKNVKVTIPNEEERIWMDAAVAYLKVVSGYWAKITEENYVLPKYDSESLGR